MPKIKVNDITIYYEIRGDGFPYVMIQGLGADVNWWIPEVIAPISQNFKAIIFDNRGTGRTDKPVMDYSIRLFADDTVGLMDALNIEKAHIFGASMGGMIAQEIAISYPERVEKLVLCCTHCGGSKQVFPSNEIVQMMATTREVTPEELVNDIMPLVFTEDFIKNNPDLIELYKQRMLKIPTPPDSYQRQTQATMSFSSGIRLKRIKAPTLILQGKEDILVPPENAELLAKRIPNAKVVLFDNAAHLLFQPDPEIVNNKIIEFLTEKI